MRLVYAWVYHRLTGKVPQFPGMSLEDRFDMLKKIVPPQRSK